MPSDKIPKNTPAEAREIAKYERIEGSDSNEIIYGYNHRLIGNSGGDELIGLSRFTAADYRNSPKGIIVNLEKNNISDGWGFNDTIFNINTIFDSRHNDTINGDKKNQTFWIGSGNDTVDGKDGYDVAQYYFNSKDEFVSLNKIEDFWELEFLHQENSFTTKIENIENISIKSTEGVLYDFILYDDKFIERPSALKTYSLNTDTAFYDYFFSKSEKGWISVKNLVTSEIIDIDRGFESVSYNNLTYTFEEKGLSEGSLSGAWFHTIFNDGAKDFLVLSYMTSIFKANAYVNSTGSGISVYSIENDKVVDLTSEYFNQEVTTYWARDLM